MITEKNKIGRPKTPDDKYLCQAGIRLSRPELADLAKRAEAANTSRGRFIAQALGLQQSFIEKHELP